VLPYSKLLPPASKQFLALDETTIAKELKAAGYVTASLGKWNLGSARYYPENQGFDVNIAGNDSGAPQSHFYPGWSGSPPIPGTAGAYLADTLTDAAEAFIRRNSAHPFFLWMAHFGVHVPLEGRKEYVSAFEKKADPKSPQHNAVYAAMVRSIDESVGRIAQRLEAEGLTDRTVFVFTSDNGGLVPATSNAPLKAGKGYLYEGGIRVPLCVVWPGAVKPGSVTDVPVIGTDFYRTVAQVAGVAKLQGMPKDSVNLTTLLRRGFPPARDALFWHYPHYSEQGGRPGGAIRVGDWKLIRWYEDDAIEFYNLRSDPGEKKNLAADQAGKARGMLALFNDWLKTMNPPMPRPNPAYDAAVETEGLDAAVQDQLKSGELPTPVSNAVKLSADPVPPPA
jgi:arylsulfatase A-like enzyme